MKQLFTIMLLFLIINIGSSQNYSTQSVYIKYAPLSLLDPFTPSIQFAVEHKLSNFKSMHYDLGYVFSADYLTYNNAKGYRARVEYRMYRYGLQVHNTNFFHGPNLIAKQTIEETVISVCITPDCSSRITVPTVNLITSIGAGYGLGWNRVSPKGRMLEFEILPGIVYYSDTNLGLPPIAHQELTGFGLPNFGFFNFENALAPTLHFMLRIGIGTN